MKGRVAVAAVLALMLITAFVLARRQTNEANAEVIAGQQVVSGNTALVPIEIDGADFDRIDNVVRSCGCMRMLDQHREEIQFPLDFSRDERKVIYLEVATAGRVGRSRFMAEFRGKLRDAEAKRVVNIDLDILPGWILNPLAIRKDNCEPGEIIESEVEIRRHKLAKDLQIEDVIASSRERMTVEIHGGSNKDDGGDVDENLELVAIAKLRYTVPSVATSDSLVIVGSEGQVRAYTTIVARTRVAQISVDPGILYWKEADISRIAWLEHDVGCSPTVVSFSEYYDVSLEAPTAASESRSVRKITIRARGADSRDGQVPPAARPDGEDVVFGCGSHRVTLRLVRQ